MSDHRTTLVAHDDLFVDLYELTMADVYLHQGMADTIATFSLFFRGYPPNRNHYVAAGIEPALEYLEQLAVTPSTVEHLRSLGKLSEELLAYISGMEFTGSVHAVSEGEILFADEPVLEVTAPVLQAQFVEAALLNIITSATIFATKASRIVHAARGRPVIDMGARRTHGADAAVAAARAACIAGFQASSLLEASTIGVPVAGTMAHSYVQAMPDELTAFRNYLQRFPNGATLLVDTYDLENGIRNAITAGKEISIDGGNLASIRIDSGDLAQSSRTARRMLDDAGLNEVNVIVSGGLDEYSITALVESGAPIDACGVGTRFGVSADAPYIDSAYKLVEFNGRPVAKSSVGKQTLPYAKQVYRTYDDDSMMVNDVIRRRDAVGGIGDVAKPLLSPVMRDGRRLRQAKAPSEIREIHATAVASLPARYRRLRNPDIYPVEIDRELTETIPD